MKIIEAIILMQAWLYLTSQKVPGFSFDFWLVFGLCCFALDMMEELGG